MLHNFSSQLLYLYLYYVNIRNKIFQLCLCQKRSQQNNNKYNNKFDNPLTCHRTGGGNKRQHTRKEVFLEISFTLFKQLDSYKHERRK